MSSCVNMVAMGIGDPVEGFGLDGVGRTCGGGHNGGAIGDVGVVFARYGSSATHPTEERTIDMAPKKQIALLWFTPANYERALALSDEPMQPTYKAWREKVDRGMRDLPADVEVVKVEADPDEIAAWCRANGGKVNTKTRAAFAAHYLMRKMQN